MLLGFVFRSGYKAAQVIGSFLLVLRYAAPEQEFTYLCQAAAFLSGNVHQGGLGFGRDPQPYPFVFGTSHANSSWVRGRQ